MITFILVIHAITCMLLVLTVLMQAGRGGGLTESFSSAESVFGAQTSAFMVRATSILATVFFVTSLSLAYMSAHQERSLMSKQKNLSAQSAPSSTVQTGDLVNQTVAPAASNDVPVEQPDVPAVPVVTNAQQ